MIEREGNYLDKYESCMIHNHLKNPQKFDPKDSLFCLPKRPPTCSVGCLIVWAGWRIRKRDWETHDSVVKGLLTGENKFYGKIEPKLMSCYREEPYEYEKVIWWNDIE
jgi:hypothetical protein